MVELVKKLKVRLKLRAFVDNKQSAHYSLINLPLSAK
jgi:hypothetical protein